jgi:diadenosine tetraphosphatase ApaH/serine/threonine PP2A family protein phosphatase
MRLAVLSDIHGNADALAAVLADVRAAAPDAIVNLGDCFSGPLDVARTADLLAAAGIAVTVRGNHDRSLLDPANMDDWDRAALPGLDRATVDWLAALPATATLGDAFLCHATPQDDLSYWMEATPRGGPVIRADLASIEARATGIPQTLMLCGHTHVPRAVHLPDGRLIVNPGSVGCPGFHDPTPPIPHIMCTGTPHASYAILDRSGTGWTITHRLIPYDTAPAVALARQRGFDDWARVLATGWL